MEATSSSAPRARRAGEQSRCWAHPRALGGALLIAAEFSTVGVHRRGQRKLRRAGGADLSDGCETTGLEQHGGALIVLGVAALLLTLVAARGTNRPAALALMAIGALAVVLALVRDLDQADETGVVGLRYEEARAVIGPGLYLEIAAGGLCVLAAGLAYPRPGRQSASVTVEQASYQR